MEFDDQEPLVYEDLVLVLQSELHLQLLREVIEDAEDHVVLGAETLADLKFLLDALVLDLVLPAVGDPRVLVLQLHLLLTRLALAFFLLQVLVFAIKVIFGLL
mmetsp:Transcript_13684/g.13406  ORF Transcript_13684/g.13406 Transcript_13684/m.13406 type:complete len:103 (-) Transcript_13684:132-440(-)